MGNIGKCFDRLFNLSLVAATGGLRRGFGARIAFCSANAAGIVETRRCPPGRFTGLGAFSAHGDHLPDREPFRVSQPANGGRVFEMIEYIATDREPDKCKSKTVSEVGGVNP